MKNSALELRWDRERDTVAKTDELPDVQKLFEAADKDRREMAAALATMAGFYADGKGNELLSAIKAIETIAVRALDIADTAIKGAFRPDAEKQ